MNSPLAPLRVAEIPRLGLRAEELAESLGISSRTLARWQSDGDGPPSVLINGTRIYPTADVAAWLTERAAETQTAS